MANQKAIERIETRLEKLLELMQEPHQKGECYHLFYEYMALTVDLPQERRQTYMDRSREINW
jgi:hypothetical protein